MFKRAWYLSLLAAALARPECPHQEPLDYMLLFPHETDCTKFYICAHGRPFLMSCGPGTEYDPWYQTCGWPNPDLSCHYANITEPTPTPSTARPSSVQPTEPISEDPTEEPTRETEEASIGPNNEDGTTELEVSTAEYINNGSTTEFFDEQTTELSAEEPTTDSESITTTNRPTSHAHDELTTDPETSVTEEANNNFTNQTESTNDEKVTEAVTETPNSGLSSMENSETATESTIVDNSTESQNTESNSESTSITETTVTEEINNINLTTEFPNMNTTEESTLDQEQATVETTDLFYTSTTESAVEWTTEDFTATSTTTAYVNSTGSTTSQVDLEVPRCPPEDPQRYLIQDPNDCGRFYSCSNGIPIHMQCPADLHFNPELLVCDYPAYAGCIANYNQINNEIPLYSRPDSVNENQNRQFPFEKPNQNLENEIPKLGLGDRFSESVNNDADEQYVYITPRPVNRYPNLASLNGRQYIGPQYERPRHVNQYPNLEYVNGYQHHENPATVQKDLNQGYVYEKPEIVNKNSNQGYIYERPVSVYQYPNQGYTYKRPAFVNQDLNHGYVYEKPETVKENSNQGDIYESPRFVNRYSNQGYVYERPVSFNQGLNQGYLNENPEYANEIPTWNRVPRCPPEDPQRYLIPNRSDCSRFYSCSNGIPIPMQCALGTYFDAPSMVCIWPHQVRCG